MTDITITDQNFDAEVLKSTLPVLVDFWAVWCGPCRMQEPIIEELAKDMEGKAKIAKLNVDENPTTAQKFGIMSIPSLLVFKGGQVVKQFVGVQSKATLQTALSQLVN